MMKTRRHPLENHKLDTKMMLKVKGGEDNNPLEPAGPGPTAPIVIPPVPKKE